MSGMNINNSPKPQFPLVPKKSLPKTSYEAPTIRPFLGVQKLNLPDSKRYVEDFQNPSKEQKPLEKRGFGIVDKGALDQLKKSATKKTITSSERQEAQQITKKTDSYGTRQVIREVTNQYEEGKDVHTEDAKKLKEKVTKDGYIANNDGADRETIENLYSKYKSSVQAAVSAMDIRKGLEAVTPNASDQNPLSFGGMAFAGCPQAVLNDDNKALVCGELKAIANSLSSSMPGLYSEEEAGAVKEYVIDKFLNYCQQAEISADKAYCLIRDNLLKIHYQQKTDHQMITGSDHGVRHIIQSNVKNTLMVLDKIHEGILNAAKNDPNSTESQSQLEKNFAKQKLMAAQVMIDHDLGYTLDAAKGSFDAAKDHPLASTAFVDPQFGGKPTYGIFSDTEVPQMQDAILKHSYPFALDKPLENNWESVEKVISIIDAMGVTADTKMPAIFRNEPYSGFLKELAEFDTSSLQKELADLRGKLTRYDGDNFKQEKEKLESKIEQKEKEIKDEIKQKEEEIRNKIYEAIDNDVKNGKFSEQLGEEYKQAAEFDLNQYGATLIRPQTAGELIDVGVTALRDGKFRMDVQFGVSQDEKASLGAFEKLGNDFPGTTKDAKGEITKGREAILKAAENCRNTKQAQTIEIGSCVQIKLQPMQNKNGSDK